jgi:protein CpxP
VLGFVPSIVPTQLHAQETAQQPVGDLSLSPEQIMDLMDSKLHLSAEQKAQIEPIIVDRRQQLIALRDDTSTRKLAKAHKMKSIFKDSDKQIEALLSDQQKQEYQQMREQMKEQIRQRLHSGV